VVVTSASLADWLAHPFEAGRASHWLSVVNEERGATCSVDGHEDLPPLSSAFLPNGNVRPTGQGRSGRATYLNWAAGHPANAGTLATIPARQRLVLRRCLPGLRIRSIVADRYWDPAHPATRLSKSATTQMDLSVRPFGIAVRGRRLSGPKGVSDRNHSR
jgi:hypothetical protein